MAELTPEEDMEITAAAMSDIDNLPLTDDDFDRLVLKTKPFVPRDTTPNIFIDPELLAAFAKTGTDWEWRINGFLRDYAGRQDMFKALLRRQPNYQDQDSNPVSNEKQRLRLEAGAIHGDLSDLNFHIQLGVEDAFMTDGPGWANLIRRALFEHAIDLGLLDRP